jgi:hypothetical protein
MAIDGIAFALLLLLLVVVVVTPVVVVERVAPALMEFGSR